MYTFKLREEHWTSRETFFLFFLQTRKEASSQEKRDKKTQEKAVKLQNLKINDCVNYTPKLGKQTEVLKGEHSQLLRRRKKTTERMRKNEGRVWRVGVRWMSAWFLLDLWTWPFINIALYLAFFLTKSTWKSGRAMKYTFSVHSVTLREKRDLLRYLDLLFSQYKPDDISSLTNSYPLTGTHIQRSMIHTASRINQFVTVKLKEFQFLPFCLGYKNSKDQSSLKLTWIRHYLGQKCSKANSGNSGTLLYKWKHVNKTHLAVQTVSHF